MNLTDSNPRKRRLRIAMAWPFYVIGTAFVVVADWLDPRPEGPNG